MEQLDHPNIVKIFKKEYNAQYPKTDGSTSPCVVLVMELCEGGNLFDVLYFTDGFSKEICRTYFQQLMSAVSHMHEKGICHRDLKPQNTLLDANMNFKICDFGLSATGASGRL